MSELPPDLKARGYKLIVRAPDRMFAVSISWGCTKTCDNLDEVIRIARDMVRWCEAMNKRKERDSQKANRARTAAHDT